MSSLLFHRALRRLQTPYLQWRSTCQVVEQLQQLAELGEAVEVRGPIRLGNPKKIRFGCDVSINPGLTVRGDGGLYVGSHCHFGEDVLILTDNHHFERPECLPYDKIRIRKEVNLSECVWICDRVIIVPGVTVGEGAVLAAGAVVTKDIPPLAVVGGSPAQVIRSRNQEAYQRLKAAGKFLDWPRAYDLVNGRRMHVARHSK